MPIFNQIVAGVASSFSVPVADIYTAFQDRSGLLLVDRNGADPLQIHPTNAGYRVMAKAFQDVIVK